MHECTTASAHSGEFYFFTRSSSCQGLHLFTAFSLSSSVWLTCLQVAGKADIEREAIKLPSFRGVQRNKTWDVKKKKKNTQKQAEWACERRMKTSSKRLWPPMTAFVLFASASISLARLEFAVSIMLQIFSVARSSLVHRDPRVAAVIQKCSLVCLAKATVQEMWLVVHSLELQCWSVWFVFVCLSVASQSKENYQGSEPGWQPDICEAQILTTAFVQRAASICSFQFRKECKKNVPRFSHLIESFINFTVWQFKFSWKHCPELLRKVHDL